MQVLSFAPDWTGILSGATELIWWACVIVGAIAASLLVSYGFMVNSEVRKCGSTLPQREFMGFGPSMARQRLEMPPMPRPMFRMRIPISLHMLHRRASA